jgi:hypothetical protein
MFQIGGDHMRAFESAARENFETRAVQHLRYALPDQTRPFSDEQLRQRVRECPFRAGRYGLVTERQVMAFVDATYLAGVFFDSDPRCTWAAPLLNSRGMAADSKAAWLLCLARTGQATTRGAVHG